MSAQTLAAQLPTTDAVTERDGAAPDLALALGDAGALSPSHLALAEQIQAQTGSDLADILLTEGLVTAAELAAAQARQYAVRTVDLEELAPDPKLIELLGAPFCLTHRILPWRRIGGAVIVATARPNQFDALRPFLASQFDSPVLMVIAPEGDILDAIAKLAGPRLVAEAETTVSAQTSCRSWNLAALRAAATGAVVLAMVTFWAAPITTGLALVTTVLLALLATSLLRLFACVAQLTRREEAAKRQSLPASTQPDVSLLVPLFEEAEIAERLVRRLERLSYPRARLDISLVVEEADSLTRDALAQADLPAWMRVVVVPSGRLKTKPRALNYALNFARGSIIGVYDAEDAPAPDQILQIVQRFRQADPKLACLQGVLDFYNPQTNWLARAFAIDYATWFRVMLPALQRLGWVIPLGGTTLFFRRSVLEEVGRWDAHNVTEDADLGLRLARHGYRTELVGSVTEEEANCRPWAWIRQRSRWIKGYAVTYAAHMQRPWRLWRDLGPWRFFGIQVVFLCALLQVALAPLLWTFWLALFGVPHPLVEAIPASLFIGVVGLLLATELLGWTTNWLALKGRVLKRQRPWIPLMHVYGMLASIAALRALAQLVTRPYYWDKTAHGIFDRFGRGTRPSRRLRRFQNLVRYQKTPPPPRIEPPLRPAFGRTATDRPLACKGDQGSVAPPERRGTGLSPRVGPANRRDAVSGAGRSRPPAKPLS